MSDNDKEKQSETDRLINIYNKVIETAAINAEIEAIKAEVGGMHTENRSREQRNGALAYDGESFKECAARIRELSKRLMGLARKEGGEER